MVISSPLDNVVRVMSFGGIVLRGVTLSGGDSVPFLLDSLLVTYGDV